MTDCEISSRKRPLIRNALLRWYRKNHRPMPWRAEPPDLPNPYHVLLSEAMLQQTQVATVIDYFNRFIDAFPGVTHLAQADEQRVLHLWQGLGYYRRARNLHAAARTIVERFNARIPDDTQQLLQLPGIGPYSAGAIASIAFGQRTPVVDGNVLRVLTRLLAIDAPADQPATTRALWTIADSLLPRGRTPSQRLALNNQSLDGHDFPRAPGDFNQALMELGATICTPRNPDCPACPLRNHCTAHADQNPDDYPVKKTKTTVKPVLHRVVAILKGDRVLLAQRPDTGLWSSMWQMPTQEQDQPIRNVEGATGDRGDGDGGGRGVGESKKPSARGLKSFIASEFNVQVNPPKHLLGFDHLTSHRKIRFELYLARYQSGRLKPNSAQWHTPVSLTQLPLSNPQRQALQHLVPTLTSAQNTVSDSNID